MNMYGFSILEFMLAQTLGIFIVLGLLTSFQSQLLLQSTLTEQSYLYNEAIVIESILRHATQLAGRKPINLACDKVNYVGFKQLSEHEFIVSYTADNTLPLIDLFENYLLVDKYAEINATHFIIHKQAKCSLVKLIEKSVTPTYTKVVLNKTIINKFDKTAIVNPILSDSFYLRTVYRDGNRRLALFGPEGEISDHLCFFNIGKKHNAIMFNYDLCRKQYGYKLRRTVIMPLQQL